MSRICLGIITLGCITERQKRQKAGSALTEPEAPTQLCTTEGPPQDCGCHCTAFPILLFLRCHSAKRPRAVWCILLHPVTAIRVPSFRSSDPGSTGSVCPLPGLGLHLFQQPSRESLGQRWAHKAGPPVLLTVSCSADGNLLFDTGWFV